VTKSASLGPTRGSVRAGLTSTLSLTLDRAEMAALGRHFGESLAVTLVATNGNGRSQARTSIAKLKGTG
jgi:ABC-type phosphate transport system permease subunit